MIFVYPPMDDEPWPTLGPDVCAWIEEHLCYGPGDLFGQPAVVDDEFRGIVYRMYEVHPPAIERRKRQVIVKDSNPVAGKRRFSRCAISVRKGWAKTERAAWIAAAELHPDGPVRCRGFTVERGVVKPIGAGVNDPYIPMIAYTEEQTEELAYGALRRILEQVAIGNDFDVGLERIMRIRGDGKAEAVSSSPNSRDGARTTFQHADETHRFTLDRIKRGWRVMLANLSKRPLADPWALETTTAYEPGAGSVAEETHEHAKQLAEKGGKSRLFFFHRQASDAHDLKTAQSIKVAVIEASGPEVAKWTDVDRIVETFQEPNAQRDYLERVYLNRPVQASGKAFDLGKWRGLTRFGYTVAPRSPITLGFDGSRYDDATALVATEIGSGFQWPLGIWEKPYAEPTARRSDADTWEVPVAEVDAAVADAFRRYSVARMYCDPPKWESWVSTWAGRYGDKVVVEWWTNRPKQMAYALRSFVSALTAGELSHDGDPTLAAHVGNAYKKETIYVDEKGEPLWVLRKERPDSPKKIDAAMAAVLSREARNDAVAAGEYPKPSIYEHRDPVVVEM